MCVHTDPIQNFIAKIENFLRFQLARKSITLLIRLTMSVVLCFKKQEDVAKLLKKYEYASKKGYFS
jgi:hypothetical protein